MSGEASVTDSLMHNRIRGLLLRLFFHFVCVRYTVLSTLQGSVLGPKPTTLNMTYFPPGKGDGRLQCLGSGNI
jgi:hypothetical protein